MTHADHGTWMVPAELELAKLMKRGGPVKIVVPTRR
jgi:hypothetical protein